MIAKADRRDAWVGLSSAPADDLKRALVGYSSDSTRAKWRALRSARMSSPKTRLTEPTLSETLIDGNGANQPICRVLSLMQMLTIAAGAFLTLAAVFIIGCNYIGIVHARRTRVGFSCVPIIGGVLGGAGFLLLPRLKLLAFIPPLVDIGCVPVLLALLVHILRRKPDSAG